MNLGVKKVKVTQSCLTLCDPMDYIVHGILQARKLEWVAFPFSRSSSQPRDRAQVSLPTNQPRTQDSLPTELSEKPLEVKKLPANAGDIRD